MTEDPLGRLAADARDRPLLYASVAVAGLAGVAAAVALSARAAPSGRASGAASLLRTVLDEAGVRAASSVDDERRDERPDEGSSDGVGPGAAAVFLGTLLSKAFTGWMRLQAGERARARGAAVASGERSTGTAVGDGAGPFGFDLRAHLEGLNATELRALAAEHGIEDRSSMNRDELVEALCGER